MKRQERRQLERVEYWQGQSLRADDFRDIAGVEAQRRWWHNRALHNAYGVYEGLRVDPSSRGIRYGVTVSPGVAHDCFGHELVLERAVTISLPSNLHIERETRVSLLIRYCPPPCDLQLERVPNVCFSQDCSISSGTVEFFWRLAECCNPTDGVAVGTLIYQPKDDLPQLQRNFRPVQPRRVARPLLFSGATVPGNTAWRPWTALMSVRERGEIPIGVQTTVDTSSAGFTATPCYFAAPQGSIWAPRSRLLLCNWFTSISDESLASFVFSIYLSTSSALAYVDSELNSTVAEVRSVNLVRTPEAFLLFAQQQQLFVSWVGCLMPDPAPVACCQPAAGVARSGNAIAPNVQARLQSQRGRRI